MIFIVDDFTLQAMNALERPVEKVVSFSEQVCDISKSDIGIIISRNINVPQAKITGKQLVKKKCK